MAARKSGEALVYKRTLVPKINEVDPTDNPSFGDMWIDISVNPPVLNVLNSVLTPVIIGGGALSPPVTITGTDPLTVPLTINGASGQSADLFDIKKNGTNAFLFSASGGLTIRNTATDVAYATFIPTGPLLQISNGPTGAIRAVFQAVAGQSVNTLEVWDNTGIAKFSVSAAGAVGIVTNGTAQPLAITPTSTTSLVMQVNAPAGFVGQFFNFTVNAVGVWIVDQHGNLSFGDGTVAPTVGAGQIGLGTTTATSASAGANGAVPAQVVGYWIVNIGGTSRKIPFFAT